MFRMGMTLTLSDIKEVILRPKEIVLGTSLQFFIMLLLGFLLAKIFRLSLELAAWDHTVRDMSGWGSI